MRYEPEADKVILTKEDRAYYELRKRECKVYTPESQQRPQQHRKKYSNKYKRK